MKLTVSTLGRGLLATAISLMVLVAAPAADTFEGRIHMEVTSAKSKGPMGIDYAIKEGKLRYDLPQDSSRRGGGGSGGVIIDFQQQEMIILMEHSGQKNFLRRSMAQTMAQGASQIRAEHPVSAPVATGKTETIAGYLATQYKFSGSNGEVSELWLAKGLGTFMFPAAQGPMGGRGAPSPEWESVAREGGFFPLRVVTYDSAGGEKARMEVTKIDKTPLPDSLFSTDGYSEFKIPDFGGGFNPFRH